MVKKASKNPQGDGAVESGVSQRGERDFKNPQRDVAVESHVSQRTRDMGHPSVQVVAVTSSQCTLDYQIQSHH